MLTFEEILQIWRSCVPPRALQRKPSFIRSPERRTGAPGRPSHPKTHAKQAIESAAEERTPFETRHARRKIRRMRGTVASCVAVPLSALRTRKAEIQRGKPFYCRMSVRAPALLRKAIWKVVSIEGAQARTGGNMKRVVNVDDLRKLAKKRLPKICYDYIEGGADDELGLITSEQAFRQMRIVPRYLVDVSLRDQSTTLFDRTYSSPIGIAPPGLADLFRRSADLMLAQAARDANVPFIMSGASSSSIEDLGKHAPDHGWYQLYSANDPSISEDMIKRASNAGLKTLVFTVDVPGNSNRERNIRNGWERPTWKTKFEALRHAAWMMEWLQHGTPYFGN